MEVAALSVAIAGAAVAMWSALSAHRSATEARRSREEARQARLDAAAPAVNVIGTVGRRERWIAPQLQGEDSLVVRPDVEFVVPRNRNDVLLLGAEVLLANEGSTTALVAIPEHSEFMEGVGDFPNHFMPGEKAALPPPANDREYSLRPGRKGLLLLRTGRTVGEWARNKGGVQAVLTIRSQFSRDVVDEVILQIDAPILEPIHGDDSHFRVAPHTLATVNSTTLRRYK